MTANFVGASTVVHPIVVVWINGYKFRALLDSGASHSYASSTAIKLIGAKCKSVGVRQIVMLARPEKCKFRTRSSSLSTKTSSSM